MTHHRLLIVEAAIRLRIHKTCNLDMYPLQYRYVDRASQRDDTCDFIHDY